MRPNQPPCPLRFGLRGQSTAKTGTSTRKNSTPTTGRPPRLRTQRRPRRPRRRLGFNLSHARRVVRSIDEIEADLSARPQVGRQDTPRRKAAEP